jgi:hypothetical protein
MFNQNVFLHDNKKKVACCWLHQIMPFPFLNDITIITSAENKVANNTTHGLKCNTIRSINFIHHKKMLGERQIVVRG